MKKSRSHKHKAASPGDAPQSMAALAEGMADDFNNILTTVMGACSLIDRDDPANHELLEYVALIRSSAERAADLSDRLLRVSSEPKQGEAHHQGQHRHGGTASLAAGARNPRLEAGNTDTRTGGTTS